MLDLLADEAGRLAALHRYRVLDTAPEQPFDKITSLVRSVLDVPMTAVSLIDRDRQWFKSSQGLDVCETAREVSFCTKTILGREPMVIPDARLDDRFAANPLVVGPPHIVSYAGAPLCDPSGYNIGALCAIDVVRRDFTEEQVDCLAKFAALVVDELELRQIAQLDQLTGVLTRRGLIEQIDKEIARYRRYGRPSALILFDIDHFKSVNDRFGHPAGDEVLRAVARTCAAVARPNDLFGRVGGEEFALLLPEVDAADAMLAAERFRGAIADAPIDIGEPLQVTASFGVAPIGSDIATAAQWLAKADVPLYAAKRAGRDRCVLAD